jgi:hypothetical protein
LNLILQILQDFISLVTNLVQPPYPLLDLVDIMPNLGSLLGIINFTTNIQIQQTLCWGTTALRACPKHLFNLWR